jgi:uncharacterized membrane protein
MSQELYIILCLLITGIFYTATTSIGIQCLNDNQKQTTSNYYFLIINLVCAIVVILSAIIMLYMSITGKF